MHVYLTQIIWSADRFENYAALDKHRRWLPDLNNIVKNSWMDKDESNMSFVRCWTISSLQRWQNFEMSDVNFWLAWELTDTFVKSEFSRPRWTFSRPHFVKKRATLPEKYLACHNSAKEQLEKPHFIHNFIRLQLKPIQMTDFLFITW